MNSQQPSIVRLRVMPRQDAWVLRVDEVPTPAWSVSTRDKAVRAAKRQARFHHALLTVHDNLGSVRRSFDFRHTAGGAA